MNLVYVAHADEEHANEVETISHTVTQNPLIVILLVSAIVLILGSIMVLFLGAKKKTKSINNKDYNANEPTHS